MNNKKDKVLLRHQEFYKRAIKNFGLGDVRSLRWNSNQTQETRFESLLKAGSFSYKTVLDLGCGYGDFYQFLLDKGQIPKTYVGVDFMSEFVKIAKKRYPQAYFIQKDFFELELKPFDYIICNGALNVKQKNNYEYIQNFILHFLPYCNRCLAITLLKEASGYVKDPFIFNYTVFHMQSILTAMKVSFEINKGYADNDFTIYIYP